ncbi:hypothetical protein ACFE04_027689 [Oxalis oulophora]
MGRGGSIGCRTNFKRRVRSKDKKSDNESDEDYVISDDDQNELADEDSEEFCDSVDEDTSDASFIGDEEDEEKVDKRKGRNFALSNSRKGSCSFSDLEDEEEEESKRRKTGSRRKARRGSTRVFVEDEDEVPEFKDEEEEDEEEEEESKRRKTGSRPKARRGSTRVFVEDEDEVPEFKDEEEEDEEEEESKRRKAGSRPRARRGSSRVFVEEEEEESEAKEFETEEDEVEDYEAKEEMDVEDVTRSMVKTSSLHIKKKGVKMSMQTKASSEEDDEDYQEEDEDTDEEFTPDEDESLDDEEEELEDEEDVRTKKNNVSVRPKKRGRPRKRPRRGQKRRRTTISKKPLKKKPKNQRRLKRKARNNDEDDEDSDYNDDVGDGDFVDNSLVPTEKSKKKSNQRKRKYVGKSDSDFVPSGASDYEFTVSEEEREQVEEANKLFGSSKGNVRCTLSTKRTLEEEQPRKLPARKGKEKIEEVKSIHKPVCGICLSEEDKRRLRGVLDCCCHFYCFTCIMEWSKVESRCPLCKQRFKTITKLARPVSGVDMRNLVISVPERDQPTEEELRSYIDPYEHVICSECHEGGDDALMLLCDLCDSSAHTFCVGLGRQVPEGNWYCDGCRPVALASASSQNLDPLPDLRSTNSGLFNIPPPMVVNMGECFDPNFISSPLPIFNQVAVNIQSQFPVGDVPATSPGAGASTLYGRRLVHRRMQDIFSNSRMNSMNVRTDGVLTANSSNELLNSEIDQAIRESLVQNSRAREMVPLVDTLFHERLQDNSSSSLQNMDSMGQSRTRDIHDLNSMGTEGSANMIPWSQSGRVNIRPPGFEQLDHESSSRMGTGSVGTFSCYSAREESQFYKVKEQLQSMVKIHLENLSQVVDLGKDALKEITRSSTHTILAICGLEHRSSEVRNVPPPAICTHMERIEIGQSSLMKDFCTSCFDSFVKGVVKNIFDTKESQCMKEPQWLSLGRVPEEFLVGYVYLWEKREPNLSSCDFNLFHRVGQHIRRWICGVMVMVVRLCIHNHGGEDGGGGGGGCELRREVGKGFVMDIIGKQCVCEDIIGVCDGQWVCCRPSPCSGGGGIRRKPWRASLIHALLNLMLVTKFNHGIKIFPASHGRALSTAHGWVKDDLSVTSQFETCQRLMLRL